MPKVGISRIGAFPDSNLVYTEARFKCALGIDDIYVRFSVINVSAGCKSIV